MRILTLIICLSFALVINAQQPWAPIHPDKMYSYKKIEHLEGYIFSPYSYYGGLDFNPVVQNIKISGFNTVGADSIFTLNKRAKPIGTVSNSYTNNQLSYIWDFEHPSFLNSEIRATSSGEYYFQGNDTFLLKPQAALNDSWIYKDTLTATVIGIESIIQWNFPDSLKTVLLSNNDTILLSRNFGILKFPDPDSIGMYIEILGLQKDTLTWGLRTPDFWDSYSFNVGDVLMYQWYEAAYQGFNGGGYVKLNITQKNWLPNGVEYSFSEMGYRESNFLIPFNRNSSPISFNFDSCQYVNGFEPNLMSYSLSTEQIPSYGWWNISSLAIASLDSNNLIRKDIYKSELQSDSIFFINYEAIYRYKVGIGFYEYNYSGFENAAESRLMGYIKDGDTVGTIFSDSLIIALSNERIAGGTNNIATIFPNPSSDGQFDIKLFEQSPEKIEVSIFNISGQLLYDETFNSSSDIINVRVVQPLAAGFYIVKIRLGKKEQYLKWQRF